MGGHGTVPVPEPPPLGTGTVTGLAGTGSGTRTGTEIWVPKPVPREVVPVPVPGTGGTSRLAVTVAGTGGTVKPIGTRRPQLLRTRLRESGRFRFRPSRLARMAVHRHAAASRSGRPEINVQHGTVGGGLPITTPTIPPNKFAHTPSFKASLGQRPPPPLPPPPLLPPPFPLPPLLPPPPPPLLPPPPALPGPLGGLGDGAMMTGDGKIFPSMGKRLLSQTSFQNHAKQRWEFHPSLLEPWCKITTRQNDLAQRWEVYPIDGNPVMVTVDFKTEGKLAYQRWRKGIALKASKEPTMNDSSDEDEVKLIMKKFCKLLKKEKVEDGPVCYGCGEVGHIKNKCPKSGRNARHFKRQRAYISWGTVQSEEFWKLGGTSDGWAIPSLGGKFFLNPSSHRWVILPIDGDGMVLTSLGRPCSLFQKPPSHRWENANIAGKAALVPSLLSSGDLPIDG
ncbi:hypothetical protein DM860_016074 [Cuscuta australis]|uniref:CCHC-type domain-containing protein n=1 Tax=Cuscuta australis TaxID=267555 RepID=A0A328E2Q4_9ASTE|nr:hypothetical protein DM860_016074 [Cuscuta australis]